MSVAARGTGIWVLFALSNGDASRATLSKLGPNGAWSDLSSDAAEQATLSNFSSAYLQALSPTSLVVANQYGTYLYEDGAARQRLGGTDTGGTASLHARSSTDTWEGTNGGSMLHVDGPSVTGHCVSVQGTACTSDFIGGIFFDGVKLWVATAARDTPQDWGIWSVRPSEPAPLRPTLGIAGDFQKIAPGPGATAWAVGSGGVAARYDGTTWTAHPTGTNLLLSSGVVTESGTDVWAAANGGIVHFDGNAWNQVRAESGMPSGASSLAVTSDGAVVAVSDGNVYRRRS